MTPARLDQCLGALDWGAKTLARLLDVPRSTVRGWQAGRSPVPASVAAWLETLARVHEKNPPPRHEGV